MHTTDIIALSKPKIIEKTKEALVRQFLIALMMALFAVSTVPFSKASGAPTLPNYAKAELLRNTWLCDRGETKVRLYSDKKEGWNWVVVEFTLSSGDVLVAYTPGKVNSVIGTYFFVKHADASMSVAMEIGGAEFARLLREKAPAAESAHYGYTDGKNDCKKK